MMKAVKEATERRSQQPNNIIWIGDTGFEADDDHLIVLQDEFKSGYECPTCGDKQQRIKRGGLDGQTESVIDCDNCNGLGKYPKNGLEIRCSHCDGTGKITCPECGGKGGKSLILPENTKGRPTTGVIKSIGKNIPEKYKLGDRLCYPSFAGHGFDLTGVDLTTGKTIEAFIVILSDRDILAKVHGTLEKRMVKQSMALHTAS